MRPYAMTRGRTRPRGLVADLVTIVVATGGRRAAGPVAPTALSREHRRLLDLCRAPATAADLASDIDLPFRVVQILLSDLHHDGLIQEVSRPDAVSGPDQRLLLRVLDGLQEL